MHYQLLQRLYFRTSKHKVKVKFVFNKITDYLYPHCKIFYPILSPLKNFIPWGYCKKFRLKDVCEVGWLTNKHICILNTRMYLHTLYKNIPIFKINLLLKFYFLYSYSCLNYLVHNNNLYNVFVYEKC